MASKIGKVLEIEPKDSYIKRPANPMITVETRDIGKLAGYIHIPSMAEGVTAKDTTLQKNPILSPPKSMPEMLPIWAFCRNLHNDQNPNLERKRSHKNSPTWSERVARDPIDTFATDFHRNGNRQRSWNKQSSREIGPISQTEGDQTR
jgi:hypothetical protein